MGQNSGLLSSLTDWNSTLAGYADSISTDVVMPVALTLLALFMILELYNATQRIAMNGSNNAFTIQQIALVMLKIVVCRWAVVHTTEILNALFEIASTVTVGISGYVGSGEYYGKVLYLRDIAPQMKDNLLSLLSDLDFDNAISIHVDAVEQREAVEQVQKQLAYMQKEKGDFVLGEGL